MGNPDQATTQTEQITATVTTTYNEAPPPYSAIPTPLSSSSGGNTVISTVSSAPPSYDEHVGTKKKQVVTVTHVPGSQPLPAGQSVRVVHLQSFGADSAIVRCPSCGYAGESRVHREGGTMMWAWVCVLFWFVAWPCSWIPCVMDDCKDVHHECPNCGTHLGEMSRC